MHALKKSGTMRSLGSADFRFLQVQIRNLMIYKYTMMVSTIIILVLFQQQLPFRFPCLLFTCIINLSGNIVLHVFSFNKKLLSTVCEVIPYFDAATAPFIFHFTGGFLSPFVFIHLLTSICSGMIPANKKIQRHTTIFLVLGYLSVAFLQKFHILENSVPYADEMMDNNVFFYFITTLSSALIFASFAAAKLERKISDEKKVVMEQQLIQTHKMQAIGHMAGGIAHDFNNIISAISGYAGLLKKRISPDNQNYAYIDHILEAGRHASVMTNQLSMLVKNDAPKVEPVDAHAVIRSAISMLQAKYGTAVQFTSCLTAQPSSTCGEETQLQNILMNLGINAHDACACSDGRISFSTSITTLTEHSILCQSFGISEGNYLCINVSDNGCGISKEILSRIFEPFFTTKPKEKGTGLGLANVWRYIETYRGAIEVTSVPDKGSTFLLYLPLHKRIGEISKTLPMPLHTASQTILIVDDEPSVREIYSELLIDIGYTVYTNENGHDALEFIRSGKITVDLVILDMVMPRMNGPETFRAIRAIQPAIKIILISGLANNKQLAELLNEHDTLFFQKSCDDKQLVEYVHRMLALPVKFDN
jgi:signal transduction histidine kinase